MQRQFPQLQTALTSGMVATHEFDFEHIQEAYEAAINDKENVVKAVIKL